MNYSLSTRETECGSKHPLDMAGSPKFITGDFCVEAVEEYRGHEVRVIMHKSHGRRVGYVRLLQPVDDIMKLSLSPYLNIEYDEIVSDSDPRFGGSSGHWIGMFHGVIDAPDIEAAYRYFNFAAYGEPYEFSCVRSIDDVLERCHRAVDSLISEFYE